MKKKTVQYYLREGGGIPDLHIEAEAGLKKEKTLTCARAGGARDRPKWFSWGTPCDRVLDLPAPGQERNKSCGASGSDRRPAKTEWPRTRSPVLVETTARSRATSAVQGARLLIRDRTKLHHVQDRKSTRLNSSHPV